MKFTLTKGKASVSVHVVWMFIILFVLAIYKFMPPSFCLFHDLTGYPCLSCGATRAANALFEGDILGMIYYNPLIVLFCAGLFFFSLFKALEYIFKFRINLRLDRSYALALRILTVISVIANWTFLIATGR